MDTELIDMAVRDDSGAFIALKFSALQVKAEIAFFWKHMQRHNLICMEAEGADIISARFRIEKEKFHCPW